MNLYNNIGWYNFIGTLQLNNKWGIQAEAHARRYNWLPDAQQSVFRLGINYQWLPKLQLRAGYAFAETYAFGNTPIVTYASHFSEHRIYQSLTISDKIEKAEIQHRFMLEQRFIQKYITSPQTEIIYPFANRIRYQIRIQHPINKKEITDKTLYGIVSNEVFIGWGKNVNANIFDQNRLALSLGYKFNKYIKVEAGYLNHIQEFGRQLNGKNIFQHNNGLLVSVVGNIKLRK